MQFLTSILPDSYSTSDNTTLLSVVLPSAAAAADGEQQYSSDLHSDTNADWSSTAAGEVLVISNLLVHTAVYISCFPCLCFGSFLWITQHNYCECYFSFCMLHTPAWLLVLGQWSKSYHVSSTQRRASLLPLSGFMPLCSAGTQQWTKQMYVHVCRPSVKHLLCVHIDASQKSKDCIFFIIWSYDVKLPAPLLS